LTLADRTLVAYFLFLDWGIPYPFRLAADSGGGPGIEAALNDIVSTRGLLQILAWAGFGLLIWFRVVQTRRIGFFYVLFATPPGACWIAFILAQIVSILFSPSLLLCTFRVFQYSRADRLSYLLFYYEGGRSGSALIRAVVSFSAIIAVYNVVMYVVYPDAVMVRSPIDGDRLTGGWLFPSDFGSAGLNAVHVLPRLAPLLQRELVPPRAGDGDRRHGDGPQR